MKTYITLDPQGRYTVWLDQAFCPRLSYEDALDLSKKIDDYVALRGVDQARIRLTSFGITSGVNE